MRSPQIDTDAGPSHGQTSGVTLQVTVEAGVYPLRGSPCSRDQKLGMFGKSPAFMSKSSMNGTYVKNDQMVTVEKQMISGKVWISFRKTYEHIVKK